MRYTAAWTDVHKTNPDYLSEICVHINLIIPPIRVNMYTPKGKQNQTEVTAMKRENAFFEEMKRVGHAWDDERRARLEQRREIEKTYGYCSEEYSTWLAENKDIPFPFTDGANKAYRAWAGSIESNADEFEFSDLLWDREVADFVDTLRKAGITEFAYTGKSTALMENIHQLAAEGCTMTGLYTRIKKEFWGETEIQGIRFSVN